MIVGTSLKAYFDRERLVDWVAQVARLASDEHWSRDVEVFVLPDLLAIPAAVRGLAGTGVAVGAQDVSARGYGPTTGDVPAARLAEEGCSLAAVGHAERRALHGEDDDLVALKVGRLLDAGMTPLVCVGERVPDVRQAVSTCVEQLERALDSCPDERRVLVAYEPVWAIGALRPADPEHVRAVLGELRVRFSGRRLSWVYGGSAMPGLLDSIADVVDGLFLGRFAHDPAALAAVVRETRSRAAPTKPS